ncbi:MAG: ABC1 kinase family protein [Planctomycetota bacterium]|jgi:ubiquinone biosynthesis protein
MSILNLPKTYGNIKRLRDIISVLIRHGFGHFLSRLNLPDKIPGMSKLTLAIQESSFSHNEPTPEKLVALLEELGPSFIKLGQLLSTRPDIIPPEYLAALTKLQDNIEPFPSEQAISIIEDSLGKPYQDLFKSFDHNPIASGSLGQVHYAVLEDNTDVVVKVKRPDVDDQIKKDIELIIWFAEQFEKHIPEIRHYRPRSICEEYARSVRQELDFVSEAAYTEKFSKNLKSENAISTPKVYWDYVSKNTIVLEKVTGKSLSEDNINNLDEVTRKNLAEKIGDSFLRQFFISGLFHADPHPGNFILGDNGKLYLIDFGQMGYISAELRQQLSFCLSGLAYGDFDLIANIYADMGGLTDESDVQGFKTSLHSLLNRYYGVPVEKLDFAQALEEIFTISRENNIYLQRELVVFGKSLATSISLAQRLYPHFRVDEAVKPFLKEIASHNFKPKNILKSSMFSLYSIANMIRKTPRDIFEIIQKAKEGKFRVIFHHEALENLGHRLDMASNRLSIAMIMSAIIVGSSMVLSNSQKLGSKSLPLVGQTPIAYMLATLGFGAAVLLGFALIISIIKSSRNKDE